MSASSSASDLLPFITILWTTQLLFFNFHTRPNLLKLCFRPTYSTFLKPSVTFLGLRRWMDSLSFQFCSLKSLEKETFLLLFFWNFDQNYAFMSRENKLSHHHDNWATPSTEEGQETCLKALETPVHLTFSWVLDSGPSPSTSLLHKVIWLIDHRTIGCTVLT